MVDGGHSATYHASMTVQIEELETHAARLSDSEKARLLLVIAPDLARASSAIDRTAGVMGGDACVAGTRIPVWLLESNRRQGWTEARILDNYPSLRAADLVAAWAYCDAHRDEIEQALREQEAA